MTGETDNSSSREETLEVYKILVEMADRVSQRRHSTNSFYLTVNTAIFGASAIISKFSSDHIEVAAISIAGLIICVLWYRILESYRNLNRVKFSIIKGIETKLSVSPFSDESDALYGPNGNEKFPSTFTKTEKFVPIVFGILHILPPLWNIPYKDIFLQIFR